MPANLAVGDEVMLKGKITALNPLTIYVKGSKAPFAGQSPTADGTTLELDDTTISHEPVIIIVD